MVKKLFKTSGMHPEYEGLMHAAIGISGEVGEITLAIKNNDISNLVEEFGDMEFYIVALIQVADISDDELLEANRIVTLSSPSSFASSFPLLAIVAADILDTAKRCWVYGNDLDDKKQKLVMDLAKLIYCIDVIYEDYAFKVWEIRKSNMDKLIGPKGRYRDLVYTDAAATARADKQETEGEVG
jgi:phosphoribosyl-ATP pyrophosphohydrolase